MRLEPIEFGESSGPLGRADEVTGMSVNAVEMSARIDAGNAACRRAVSAWVPSGLMDHW
ncbi:hypothetical protein MBRU_12075 [Mycolicibacterium brumae DSM 44177]|nr:hypothetical protein MBRU_12075 [Mycolicibacterium brumae DSM 44177]